MKLDDHPDQEPGPDPDSVTGRDEATRCGSGNERGTSQRMSQAKQLRRSFKPVARLKQKNSVEGDGQRLAATAAIACWHHCAN